MTPALKKGLTLYYCYASEDKMLRDELDKHLMALKIQGRITTWHQGEVQAGSEWKREISVRLKQSDVILLLVSPDFLASEEIYRGEMAQALIRHEQHQALVIPILLRPADREGTPLNRLQALPANGKPVTQWNNRDEVFFEIAQGIRNAINALLEETKTNKQLEDPPADAPLLEDTERTTLMEAKYRPIQSVFFFNMPLPDYKEFYGRRREYAELLDRTSKRSSTSIVGQRRVGKTWFLHYMLDKASLELGSRFRIAYVDGASPACATVSGFILSVLVRLGVHYFPARDETIDLVFLEKKIKEIRRGKHIPVICIDEFEGLAHEDRFDQRFFMGLRAMAESELVLIVASQHPLIDIVTSLPKTSPFFNIFRTLTLRPFSNEEAEEFIRAKSSQAGFSDQEQERLSYYTREQRLPIRFQLVGTLLLTDKLLAEKEGSNFYRPDDPLYWRDFERRLEEQYQEVVH